MRKELEDAADDIARNLIKDAAEVKKLLDEKRVLSKSDREWIVDVFKSAGRKLSSDLPFLNELFQEQMDKTVTEAKGEFESYLQNLPKYYQKALEIEPCCQVPAVGERMIQASPSR